MTQLKTVIWPDAPPAKPESDELTFTAKKRAAEMDSSADGAEAGLVRQGDCYRLLTQTEQLRSPPLPSGKWTR